MTTTKLTSDERRKLRQQQKEKRERERREEAARQALESYKEHLAQMRSVLEVKSSSQCFRADEMGTLTQTQRSVVFEAVSDYERAVETYGHEISSLTKTLQQAQAELDDRRFYMNPPVRSLSVDIAHEQVRHAAKTLSLIARLMNLAFTFMFSEFGLKRFRLQRGLRVMTISADLHVLFAGDVDLDDVSSMDRDKAVELVEKQYTSEAEAYRAFALLVGDTSQANEFVVWEERMKP